MTGKNKIKTKSIDSQIKHFPSVDGNNSLVEIGTILDCVIDYN